MPLFDTSLPEVVTARSAVSEDKETVFYSSDRECTMAEAVGELAPGRTTHFVTAGSWSLYELLAYVLRSNHAMNCRVEAFTWNLGEAAVRAVIALREQGHIASIRVLCHNQMKSSAGAAVAVLQQHAEKVVLYNNHAKGFLILADDGRTWSCIGSANFANNPRMEAGVITMDPKVREMHLSWLEPIFARREFLASNTIKAMPLFDPPPPEGGVLLVCRGMPGSGKTTLARCLCDETYSNDDYFATCEGKYAWDSKKMPHAANQCYNRVKMALENGVKRVAVANVFAEDGDVQEYIDLGRRYNYRVHVICCENRHGGESVHGIEEKSIERMREKFRVKL